MNPSSPKSFSGELSGFDLETKIDEKLTVERSKWETEQRQKEQAKEIQELKAKLTDAEEYITTLENSVEDLKTNGTKAKAGWGEIASVALEGIIRRNPQLLTAIPGGEALAGILSESPQQNAIEDTPQSEVSFQPKTESASTSTENSERLIVIKMIQDNFDPVQLAKVWEILKELSENPDSIQPVLELLQTS
jgi:predicted RNase H-like nuclease (RuvC/YqgF family)